jgi:antitoxin CptB
MQTYQKRLMYKSTHRGTKEMDLVLGAFAQNNLQTLNEEVLKNYDQLLDESDNHLFDWIVLEHNTFPTFYTDLIHKIRQYIIDA